MLTDAQMTQIRKTIEIEDEARERVPPQDLKPVSQNARHRRELLSEVDRLRELLNCQSQTS